MKLSKLIFLLLFLPFIAQLSAYQRSFLNLVSPTQLGSWESEIQISHRAYWPVDNKPFENFFGLDFGADVGLYYRQDFMYNLELRVGYIRDNKEYQVEGSYKFTPDSFPVQAQANIQYYSFREPVHDTRQKNALCLLAVQSQPILDRFYLNANVGYDGYYKWFGNGYGLGVITIPEVTLLGEYYPVWDRNSATGKVALQLQAHDSYAFGVRADLYGHQFTALISNSSDLAFRHIAMGSFNIHDYKFGFNIQRHLPVM